MKVEYNLEEKDIKALKDLADVYHGPCTEIQSCTFCPFFYELYDYCVPEAASALMKILKLDGRADNECK